VRLSDGGSLLFTLGYALPAVDVGCR